MPSAGSRRPRGSRRAGTATRATRRGRASVHAQQPERDPRAQVPAQAAGEAQGNQLLLMARPRLRERVRPLRGQPLQPERAERDGRREQLRQQHRRRRGDPPGGVPLFYGG